MGKEKNEHSISHFRKYWSIELAFLIMVIGFLLPKFDRGTEHSHIFMPLFLALEYLYQSLFCIGCGLIFLPPLALLDWKAVSAKILVFRILAFPILFIAVYFFNGELIHWNATTYHDMLSIGENQYYILREEIGNEDYIFNYFLFYECSQQWCDLIEDYGYVVNLTYEPTTNMILLMGESGQVLHRYKAP